MKTPFTYLYESQNLNTFTSPGIYCIAASCTNAPTGSHCMVLVQNGCCGTAFQICKGDNQTEVYERHGFDSNGCFYSS